MKYDPQIHHRCSIRLQGYDYTLAGAYFVTICVQNRECALGDIVDGEMRYSSNGRIVRDFWPEVEAHFPHVEVASFVIMPNHVHAIIIIRDVAPSEGHQSAMRRGVVTTPPHPTPPHPTPLHPTPPHPTPLHPTPLHPTPKYTATQSDPGRGNPTPTGGKPDLGHIVAFYKYQTTKLINAQSRGVVTTPPTPGRRFWQRNYYEHIIRDDADLRRIEEYIRNNPRLWEQDQLHPQASPDKFNQDR